MPFKEAEDSPLSDSTYGEAGVHYGTSFTQTVEESSEATMSWRPMIRMCFVATCVAIGAFWLGLYVLTGNTKSLINLFF